MENPNLAISLAGVLATASLISEAPAFDLTKDRVQYSVSTSHLDTQWMWTFQTTRSQYIPATFNDNLALLRKYPTYVFNCENVYHYMIEKLDHPDVFAQVKQYVASGQWHLSGGSIVASDVNVPSPESLIRQYLYGNGFFESEFGKRATDVFLPDCFGFGMALPTVAAHCGLTGFSTQKVYCEWLPQPSGAYPKPFDIGVWQGVDGAGLISAIYPGPYGNEPSINDGQIDTLGAATGIWACYRYMGVGDRGGAASDGEVATVTGLMAQNATRATKVLSAASDQLFQDIIAQNLTSKLKVYKGELLAREHGTGTYTSRVLMKQKNRRNEQLAAAAEAASVMAAWQNLQAYPADTLISAWIRFLWHQFHDDITGTSIDEAYTQFSYPDEDSATATFQRVINKAVAAIGKSMDTRVQGTPVAVYNPLPAARRDVVVVNMPALPAGKYYRVFDATGQELPAQAGATAGGSTPLAMVASLPSLSVVVFDVRQTATPCSLSTGLAISTAGLSNDRYAVSVNANGDIAAILDKKGNRQLLSSPIQLQMFNNTPNQYPEWEINYDNIKGSPRATVGGPATISIVENGPARVTLRIVRQNSGSTFTQNLLLAAGGERLEIASTMDWNTSETLLKMAFPLAASKRNGVFDLGIGAIERPTNTMDPTTICLYESPAQQWAAIDDQSGSFGTAILNDCKYGWDKPSNTTLRLTIVHSPGGQDIGNFHAYRVAVYGYDGDWRNGDVVNQAARLNQPPQAFVVDNHSGTLGAALRLVGPGSGGIAIMACKKAEKTDQIAVRVRETEGAAKTGARLTFGSSVLSVEEANGMEDPLSSTSARIDGKDVVFDIGAFAPKTFLIRLSTQTTAPMIPRGKTRQKRFVKVSLNNRSIRLWMPEGESHRELTMQSLEGRIVHRQPMTDKAELKTPLPHLTPGVYAVSAGHGSGSSERVVVTH